MEDTSGTVIDHENVRRLQTVRKDVMAGGG
jgi:hypothetical protein